VVAPAAAEEFRPRGQVQLAGPAVAGDAAHDQRADEPPAPAVELRRRRFEANGDVHIFLVPPAVMQVGGRRISAGRDIVADARLSAARPGPGQRTGRAGVQPLAQVLHADDKGILDGIFLPLPAPPVAATRPAHTGPLTPAILPKSIGVYALPLYRVHTANC